MSRVAFRSIAALAALGLLGPLTAEPDTPKAQEARERRHSERATARAVDRLGRAIEAAVEELRPKSRQERRALERKLAKQGPQ